MARRLTTKEFIQKAIEIHGNKYDYSKVEYKNNKTKVCIICLKHGEFWQIPNSHLNGSECPKCSGKFLDKEYFIEKANKIHNNKYDYSKLVYLGNKTKVEIICSIHGSFWQTPNDHLDHCGCPECRKSKKLTTETFIKRANQTHNNLYDYSKVQYINADIKIEIICKRHGSFWQLPSNHIAGQDCPKCRLKEQSKLYEKIKSRFPDIEIIYEADKIEWLKPQRFDIYFPKYNIAVEYNGIQHYRPVINWGGEIYFQKQLEWDKLKREKSKINNCTLFDIKYNYTNNDFETLISNINLIIYGTN